MRHAQRLAAGGLLEGPACHACNEAAAVLDELDDCRAFLVVGDALRVHDDDIEVIERFLRQRTVKLFDLEALAIEERGKVAILHADLRLLLVRDPVHRIHEQRACRAAAVEVAVVAEDERASFAVARSSGEREFGLATIRRSQDGERKVSPDGHRTRRAEFRHEGDAIENLRALSGLPVRGSLGLQQTTAEGEDEGEEGGFHGKRLWD